MPPPTSPPKLSLSSLRPGPAVWRLAADYGVLGVLGGLCLYFAVATIQPQHSTNEAAAQEMAQRLAQAYRAPAGVVIVTGDRDGDRTFADTLGHQLETAGFRIVAKVHGEPAMIKRVVEDLIAMQSQIDCFATTLNCQPVVSEVLTRFPQLGSVAVQGPETYSWPTFFTLANLDRVVHRIVILGIIGVGMTLVMMTGGIDLSVGSLAALSTVATSSIIEGFGGPEASTLAMLAACLAAIAICGAVGAFSGTLVSRWALPPFLVTLAVMLVARGAAFRLTDGQPVAGLPDAFTWLGRGADLVGIPNGVVLLAIVCAAAYLVMIRTTYGQWLLAVGGNRQAAKLSGNQASRTLLVVYTVSGMLAGLAGLIVASRFQAGEPGYGQMEAFYVVAAVVLGGTSLFGGEGRVLGTLLGTSVVAVLENGLKLTQVEGYMQNMILGLVILTAVLADAIKKHGWRGLAAAVKENPKSAA
jgi:ribose transport system permease protein